MNNDVYILVSWPESQELMEKEWFNECILGDNSSYFVPENRMIELYENDYIIKRSKELALLLKSTKEEENYIQSELAKDFPFEGGMNTFESILNLKLLLNNDNQNK